LKVYILAVFAGFWLWRLGEAFGGLYYAVALVTISLFFDDHQMQMAMRTKIMDMIRIGVTYSFKL